MLLQRHPNTRVLNDDNSIPTATTALTPTTATVVYRTIQPKVWPDTPLVVTILAGGKGKRMKSELPKVLHCIDGVPMLVRIVREVLMLKPYKIVVVVGEFRDQIRNCLLEWIGTAATDEITFALQKESKGTGDAVASTLEYLESNNVNVILNGDNPLLKHETIESLLNSFVCCKSDLQVTAIRSANPYGCGRIVVDENNHFQRIVEEKDCNEVQRAINTVNCGIYIATGAVLKSYIGNIKNTNASGEYYLTDIVEIAKTSDKNVTLCVLDESKEREILNINTAEELERVNNLVVNAQGISI